MNYVPNLIPEQSRVKLDDNIELFDTPSEPVTVWIILSYIAAGLFLIGGLGTIVPRFWEGFTCLVLGLAFLPQGHRWIEKKLRFKFTWRIKGMFIIALVSLLIPVSLNYTKQYQEIAAKERSEREKIAAEEQSAKREAEKKERERSDSLNYFLSKADSKFKANQIKSAITFINSALKFTNTQNELVQKRALYYTKMGQFNDAIADYTTLINTNSNRSGNYYDRALCYEKLNLKREAIDDLKQATEFGNSEASKLYERLNPIKRRVSYYVTRCCDGTTSSSKGRGACSHHRGVCNWNDPVYEEYREF